MRSLRVLTAILTLISTYAHPAQSLYDGLRTWLVDPNAYDALIDVFHWMSLNAVVHAADSVVTAIDDSNSVSGQRDPFATGWTQLISDNFVIWLGEPSYVRPYLDDPQRPCLDWREKTLITFEWYTPNTLLVHFCGEDLLSLRSVMGMDRDLLREANLGEAYKRRARLVVGIASQDEVIFALESFVAAYFGREAQPRWDANNYLEGLQQLCPDPRKFVIENNGKRFVVLVQMAGL